jgi:hypothetical protein
MTKEKIFKLELKNGQIIELKFSSIAQTNDQLWQMFATTEALNTVQQLIDMSDTETTKSARKTPPKKSGK